MTAPVERRSAPGPRGHLLLGIAPEVRRDPLGVLLNAALRYAPVVGYRFGPKRGFLVTHPDGVRHVLQDNVRNYTKDHVSYSMVRWMGGDGLLTSQGETWLRQRRLAQPAFHRQRIAAMAGGMAARAKERAEAWDARARSGEPVDVMQEMMELALGIVGEALLGSDVAAEAKVVGESFLVMSEQIVTRFRSMRLLPPVLPFGEDRAFRQARQALDAVVYRLIARRRRAPAERADLMSLLMNAVDEDGSRMNDVQLHDEVVIMLIAGHETTATALTWTWAMLDANPEVEAQLHAELDRVLASRSPTFDDLPALAYTRAVIDETMRLYPPVYVVSRKVRDDDTIAGFHIPRGSWMDVSPYATHRMPDLWPEPEAFRPERFLGDAAASRPRFAYFPFSGGPRQCIGNQFALVEAQLVLATLASRFRVRRTERAPLVPEPLLTLRPRGGLPARIERRTAGP